MSDTTYSRLREFLDRFPLGFPQTSSGVEIEILKRLFTEQEAETALLLTPFLEEVPRIAERAGVDARDLERQLALMANKGLVFRVRRDGKTLYRASPFMIGLYEYSINRIDRELALLYRQYYDTAYLAEMGASDVPGFKVVPVEDSIAPDTVLFPFHKLEDSIRRARKAAVAECVCRKEAQLIGEGCDHPMEACLSFGVAAEYYIENGIGREISNEEAIEIVRQTDRAGLVHAGANSKHLSNICNCCPCCCASMKGITKKGHDKHKYLNALFEAVVDEGLCLGCEECIDRCPVAAITVEDVAVVDRQQCLGCGLCAGTCPSEAMTLHLREDGEGVFDRVADMAVAVLEGKKRNAEGK